MEENENLLDLGFEDDVDIIDNSLFQELSQNGNVISEEEFDKNNGTEEEGKPSSGGKSPVNPESVGTEDDKEEKDAQAESKGSPTDFNSIASFFQDMGIFQTLSKEDIDKFKDEEDGIQNLLEREVRNRVDERNKLADEARQYRVPQSKIAEYENLIDLLQKTTDQLIKSEGQESENNRKIMIMENYITKGMSKEEAEKLAKRSIDGGNDIEDALIAKKELLEYYKSSYQKEIDDAKKKSEESKVKAKEDAEKLKKAILEGNSMFKDLDLSVNTREQIYEAVTKPIVEEDGRKLTAIQKYMKDHNQEYCEMVGTFFVLTKGFTDLSGLIKTPVTKKVNNTVKNFANLINTTSRNNDGSLNLKSGVSAEQQSMLKEIANWDPADE